MANVQLLEEVMTFIDDHPDKHDQMQWLSGRTPDRNPAHWCATSGCFAGWAIVLSGVLTEAEIGERVRMNLGDDWCVQAPQIAQGILDIPFEDRTILFHGNNTRENLGLMVKDIVNGEHLHRTWAWVRSGDTYTRIEGK